MQVFWLASFIGLAHATRTNPLHRPLQPFGSQVGDLVLVDAGSSGSKVFAFYPQQATQKLYTRCSDAKRKAGKVPNLGIASLAYNKADCEWQVGSDAEKPPVLTPLDVETDYAGLLLKLLSDTYLQASGKPDLHNVINRGSVPMLATAGMRLVSGAENAKVWSYLCGKSGSGLTLATTGTKCGTIPGTTEAYYEFLANAAKGNGDKVLTGTFTIGGASSQISIPLKTSQDVKDFEILKAAIADELDCTKLKLVDGSVAPIFNAHRKGGPSKECIDDYITFKPVMDIKASVPVEKKYVQVSKIQGVGLISFLGLQGRGTFVAGGVNEIQHWAAQEKCDTPTSEFQACAKKLEVALSKDIMWKHVTSYFKKKVSIQSFSYNTPAAVPSMAGMKTGKGENQGWKLRDELDKACEADNSDTFGYKDQNTCMKALYTSMYVVSFFPKSAGGENDPIEIHTDWKRSWSEGKVEEMVGLVAESSKVGLHTSLESMLDLPLQRHDISFIDGFALTIRGKGD